jgi:hypothetical protein
MHGFKVALASLFDIIRHFLKKNFQNFCYGIVKNSVKILPRTVQIKR